jgi:hypothetical protein
MDGVILSWMDVNFGKVVLGKFLGSFWNQTIVSMGTNNLPWEHGNIEI